ncbi:hypothetical protein L207DRAFT_524842 [Hyaloscypha variabilis F]|uniref:Uncharacterized protein n=1 Tax=Hyaloscypha variabilis (strain UAMH 11265 / GT02V1 / F) TaxID=1149755 RepID=A0A2J6S3X6_HYAVF|nr:hypothetical protein L207DRAFT_524842 [Hyaloscypha variabilis F]
MIKGDLSERDCSATSQATNQALPMLEELRLNTPADLKTHASISYDTKTLQKAINDLCNNTKLETTERSINVARIVSSDLIIQQGFRDLLLASNEKVIINYMADQLNPRTCCIFTRKARRRSAFDSYSTKDYADADPDRETEPLKDGPQETIRQHLRK